MANKFVLLFLLLLGFPAFHYFYELGAGHEGGKAEGKILKDLTRL